jgi:hypothetical protein
MIGYSSIRLLIDLIFNTEIVDLVVKKKPFLLGIGLFW